MADLKVDALVADTNFRKRDPRFSEAYRHKPPEKQRKPGEYRSKWFTGKDFEYDEANKKVDAQWKPFALVHNVQKLRGKAT